MHPHLAVISALQLQEANTGELKCNGFKNTSTLHMENSFCEPSLLTKYLKQLHPCREEAGCVTCPNSSHHLLSCPLSAGQPWHHRAVDKGRMANRHLWPRSTIMVLSHLQSRTLLVTLVLLIAQLQLPAKQDILQPVLLQRTGSKNINCSSYITWSFHK